jgi:hypothetical protein
MAPASAARASVASAIPGRILREATLAMIPTPAGATTARSA